MLQLPVSCSVDNVACIMVSMSVGWFEDIFTWSAVKCGIVGQSGTVAELWLWHGSWFTGAASEQLCSSVCCHICYQRRLHLLYFQQLTISDSIIFSNNGHLVSGELPSVEFKNFNFLTHCMIVLLPCDWNFKTVQKLKWFDWSNNFLNFLFESVTCISTCSYVRCN